MKRILRRVQATNPEAAEWLRVIETFDELVADEADLDRLAKAAARIAGRSVGIDDMWNGRRVWEPRAAAEAPDASALEQWIIGTVVATRLRGRRAVVVRDAVLEACVASVEVAAGRIGSVWLVGAGRPWETIDHVTAERLAAAVAANALRLRATRTAEQRGEPAALERLLAGKIPADEIDSVAEGIRLPARDHVVIVVGERPKGAASPETILQVVLRAARTRGVRARGTVVGRRPAVVALPAPDLDRALEDLVSASADLGFTLEFGVSDVARPPDLARAWLQAREALALISVGSGERNIARFPDLGILHLLAHIPRELLLESADFRRMARLDDTEESPTDLELLERYCETGSLRRTASQVFLHHTSVDGRLKRIERQLGISLASPSDRLAAYVAVKLLRIERARTH